MIRRAAALYTSLCLLAMALFTPQPAKAELVCRMTGRPMAAAAQAAPMAVKSHRSCCEKAAAALAKDVEGASLTHSGCCELRQSKGQPHPAAALTDAAPIVAALASPAPAVTVTVTAAPAGFRPAYREPAPRAPPGAGATPRAPPFFF